MDNKEKGKEETLTSARKTEVWPEIGGSEVIGGVTAVDEIPRLDGEGGGGPGGPPWRRRQRREPPRRNHQHVIVILI